MARKRQGLNVSVGYDTVAKLISIRTEVEGELGVPVHAGIILDILLRGVDSEFVLHLIRERTALEVSRA